MKTISLIRSVKKGNQKFNGEPLNRLNSSQHSFSLVPRLGFLRIGQTASRNTTANWQLPLPVSSRDRPNQNIEISIASTADLTD